MRTAVREINFVPHARRAAVAQREASVAFGAGAAARVAGRRVGPLPVLRTEHRV